MFRLQQHRIVLTAIMLTMLVILGVLFPIQAQEGDSVIRPFLNNVIQLTVTFSNGVMEHGFGFVVGERGNLLYVITADHVVRKDDPDSSTERIQARFNQDQGNFYDAKLLNLPVQYGLDAALLEIRRPFPDYTWQPAALAPDDPQRGDRAWFVGRNEEWWIPLDNEAGIIQDAPFRGEIPVSMRSVQPGTSGAPLFTTQGIVGMIVTDSSEQVTALSIETLRQLITRKWKYPWGLEEFQASTATPTPTPRPPTPTATPKPQPTAIPTSQPSQEEKSWIEPITGMEFVWVPEGCFQMGQTETEKNELIRLVGEDEYKNWFARELPRHQVCVDGFWMGKYEVTQAQWQHVMGNNPSYFEGNNRPVEQVSWDDAQEFINKLNSRSNFTFRLPSEAEWEYAARAGTQTAYSFGNDSSRLGEYAWYDDNSGNETHPVGTLKPNEWGLYDMHGNVWEWCQDIYRVDAYKNHQRQNPLITSGGSNRVLRGGSWVFIPRRVRCAVRYGLSPSTRRNSFGFRLVRSE